MTKPLRAAVEIIVRYLDNPKNILEIGSKQAKNQEELANLRSLFSTGKYIGLDMHKGRGVDMVANAEKLPFNNRSFDLIFCLETLEHCDKPWLISAEIERVLKSNGVVIVSSQQNFPIHKHPNDYFRFTPFGLSSLFPNLSQKIIFSISPPFKNEVKLNPQQVVLVGTNKNKKTVLSSIKRSVRSNVKYISVHKPYRHRLIDSVGFIKRAVEELFFRQEVEFFN